VPIHEYQCEKCGYIFEEVTLKMSTVKITTKCPNCQEIAKRLISSGAFIVHGYNSNNGYAGHMR
jgi:putative FmdB family regulatory protein